MRALRSPVRFWGQQKWSPATHRAHSPACLCFQVSTIQLIYARPYSNSGQLKKSKEMHFHRRARSSNLRVWSDPPSAYSNPRDRRAGRHAVVLGLSLRPVNQGHYVCIQGKLCTGCPILRGLMEGLSLRLVNQDYYVCIQGKLCTGCPILRGLMEGTDSRACILLKQ